MKRITKKKLELNRQTIRVLVRPIDSNELKHVVGGDCNGGSLINCQTRKATDACSNACNG